MNESFLVMVQPCVIWLDQPDEAIRAMTGGRSVHWLFKERQKGLAIHRRGEGKSARYFVIPRELEQYLIDTSATVWTQEEPHGIRKERQQQPQRISA